MDVLRDFTDYRTLNFFVLAVLRHEALKRSKSAAGHTKSLQPFLVGFDTILEESHVSFISL